MLRDVLAILNLQLVAEGHVSDFGEVRHGDVKADGKLVVRNLRWHPRQRALISSFVVSSKSKISISSFTVW